MQFKNELKELGSIAWEKYSHAYGDASDVPEDILSLVSSEQEIRSEALMRLFGSIWHQGTMYSSTIVAASFIVKLALNENCPEKAGLLELINALAESSTSNPELIKNNWVWRGEKFGEIYAESTNQMANNEIKINKQVHTILLGYKVEIEKLVSSQDADVANYSKSILNHLEGKN